MEGVNENLLVDEKLIKNGFQIINEVYKPAELTQIETILTQKKVAQQFGIRAFLKNHPALNSVLFNDRLRQLIDEIQPNAQVIKCIYFDKPPTANWIVNWHQDLTINVVGKTEKEGYKNWRILKERTVVQPPLEILDNIFTIRVHLDDCKKENGALRVMRGSHKNGIVEVKDGVEAWRNQKEICAVKKGGILIMKPLLLHASRRTENAKRRRVIHIEFSNTKLPDGVDWQEGFTI